MRCWQIAAAALALLCVLPGEGRAQTAGAPLRFNVPSGDALRTLRMFSEQSREQILYPIEQVRGIKTRAVTGELTARAALERMLEGTGLTAVEDRASGAFVIKRIAASAKRNSPAAADGRPRDNAALAAKELVVLSPFEVLSRTDRGYQAANSVSATRMASPIRDLPMSISAFTEEFIADQKAYDLYDVVKWAPGVHQDNQSPQGWIRYNIRGFTSAAVQRNGFGSFRFVDTTNIARIEVVKGPASLLYGQVNPGGVINYITKRPEARPAVRLTAGGGDHRYKHLDLDATGPVPLTNDRLFYRAIAMIEDIQQFQNGARGTKHMLAPSATWKVSDRVALTLELEHFERSENMLTGGVVMDYRHGVASGPYAGLPWDFNYAGEGDYQDFVSDAFTAELAAQLGERMDLKTTYRDSYWDMEWRATGQGATGLIGQSFIDRYYPAAAQLTPAHAMYRRNRWEHHWGGERTLQADLAGTFELGRVAFRTLLGGRRTLSSRIRILQKVNPNIAGHPSYLKPWDLRNPATWDRAVPFGLDALRLSAHLQDSTDSSSLYGVVSASALDHRLRVLAGYARHRIHNHGPVNFFAGTQAPAADRAAYVPQAGVLYRLMDGLSAFASYSESFVANISMLRVNNAFTTPAAPTRGQSGEFGLKVEWLQGKVSGTVSAYRIEALPTGIVSFTSGVDASGVTLFTDVQGGRQLSEGFEFEFLLKPTPAWQIVTGFSRSDAVYSRHPSNPALDGSPLVATPDFTFSLWGKYAPTHGPLARFTVSGGVNRVGSFTYVGNNPSARAPAYTTVDLSTGYRFTAFERGWEAELAVRNVTNERYYASASSWGFPRHTLLTLRTTF